YRAQGLWGSPDLGQSDYSQVVELDLSSVTPSVSGPRRPQDRINLPDLKPTFLPALTRPATEGGFGRPASDLDKIVPLRTDGGESFHPGGGSQEFTSPAPALRSNINPDTEREMANNRPTPDSTEGSSAPSLGGGTLRHGSVVIAAITSCTNT